MVTRSLYSLTLFVVLTALVAFNGCKRDLDLLNPAAYPKDAEIFSDGFGPGVQFQAFGDSKLDALTVTVDEKYSGTTSIKITVPNDGDQFCTYPYAGGVLVSAGGRDLTGYNALTLWAKSSVEVPSKFKIGIGNDNTGTSKYVAMQENLSLHTIWTKYILPIPDAAKLTKEKGLFLFAASNINGTGYNIWFDDIKFESIGTIISPRASITTGSFDNAIEGDTMLVNSSAINVTFDLNGKDISVQASPSYLTYFSFPDSVATVNTDGVIRAAGPGNATVTAKLGSVDVTGKVKVNNVKAATGPAGPAPTPLPTSDKVVSLFSNAYNNIPVDTWNANWPNKAKVADRVIGTDSLKLYTTLDFAGIIFAKNTINASSMTHLHMDIWTQYPISAASSFKVKLVDFGENGVYGGADDAQSEIAFTMPVIKSGSWVSLDIPLFDFSALTSESHLAQLVISGTLKTVWLDNIYFYQGTAPTGTKFPTVPAPAPTAAGINAISIFSDAFANVTVDKLAADWGTASQVYKSVGGTGTLLYSNLGYTAIEFTGANIINASAMDRFHMDIWTPNQTAASYLKIKFEDFGSDGLYGGGNDTESVITLTSSSKPALTTGSWISIDTPLAKILGVNHRSHLGQLVLEGAGNVKTAWLENIYFYRIGPGSPAPVPTIDPGNVISLFSDSYSNVTVDKWRTDWSVPSSISVSDLSFVGNNVKIYNGLSVAGGTGYVGIEFSSQTINASDMTAFHMDIWTPNTIVYATAFKIKLVDFGADGVFGNGDDKEQELSFGATTIPALTSGSWVSLELPLSRFTNLTTKGHLAQLVISVAGGLQTVWVDNIYFHK